jgi:release factor glutamine methyltransferase
MSISISSFTNRLALIYEKTEAQNIVLLLLQQVTKLSRARLLSDGEVSFNGTEAEEMGRCMTRVLQHEPIQYILGSVEFHGVSLKVDRRVLIPRPETEELVEWVLQESSCARCIILDCCTGSGCIAVALAKQLPEATLSACDISLDALEVARENAVRNQVKIHFFETDVLSPEFTAKISPADIIVCNPPYVLNQEAAAMHANVLKFEPHKALFVSDDDPLIFYRAIANAAVHKLSPKGKLFFEINSAFGHEVVRMLKLAGFTHIESRNDLSGNARMVCAQR